MTMKWFRKHTKKMMAVVVVGLMIAFLVPQAIHQLGSGGSSLDVVVGKAYGKDITRGNLMAQRQRVQILYLLGVRVFDRLPLTLLDYYLLGREARHGGLEVSEGEIDRFFQDAKITRAQLEKILKDSSQQARGGALTENDLREAVGDFLLFQKAMTLAASAAPLSEAQVRHFFRNRNEKADVVFVRFSANRYQKEAPEPTEKQLIQQFNTYKDKSAGEGGAFGFGYRWPNRVEIEYLAADAEVLAKAIQISEEDLLNEYLRRRDREFRIKKEGDKKEDKEGEAVKYRPLSEVKILLTDQIRRRRAAGKARLLIAEAVSLTAAAWEKAKPRPNEDQQAAPEKLFPYISDDPETDSVVREVEKRHGVKLAYHKTKLLTAEKASQLSGIGEAVIPRSGRGIPFFRLALSVDVLLTPEQQKMRRRADVPRFMLGQDSPLLIDEQGSAYVFRVIGYDTPHQPSGLAEVRSDVIRDVKMKWAYERAETEALKLIERSRKNGLAEEGDKKAKGQGKEKRFNPKPFARMQFGYGGRMMPSFVEGIGSSGEFIRQVFAMTDARGPHKLAVIRLPRQRMVVALELEKMIQPTEGDYTTGREQTQALLRTLSRLHLQSQWLRSANIRKRVAFKDVADAEAWEEF